MKADCTNLIYILIFPSSHLYYFASHFTLLLFSEASPLKTLDLDRRARSCFSFQFMCYTIYLLHAVDSLLNELFLFFTWNVFHFFAVLSSPFAFLCSVDFIEPPSRSFYILFKYGCEGQLSEVLTAGWNTTIYGVSRASNLLHVLNKHVFVYGVPYPKWSLAMGESVVTSRLPTA